MENQKNKILIISLAYHPFVGGAEVAIKEITQRLGSDFSAPGGQGFCFDMITCNLDGVQKSEEENFNGIDKIYRISLFPHPYQGGGWGGVKKVINKYLFPWLAYKKAVELQNENNYSVVWAMMANQAGWAAKKFKKKFPRIKYLLTLQEGDSELDIWLRTWFIRPLYKNIYKTADYIQAISNFLKKRAINLGAKCKIEVVPNGIGTVIARSEATKQSQGIKRVITVSRLVEKNGLRYLIEAMTNVDGKLIILGNGKLEFKLKSLTKNLNLENKVEFLGEVTNDQVYEYLNTADVFARPSLSEGLGNAFLEAMAQSVPVIATPVGGIPDFLEDGKTGWFCKVKNPKSIADKINYILDEKNKEEVNMVIENARKMVIEKYNWDQISIKMKNIFIKLINN